MTVSTTTARVAYTGNGVTVAFTVPFKFLTNADIAVYVNNILQVSGVVVTGAGADTGTATFAVAPANLARVVLVRAQVNDQQTDLPPNGPFPAQTVETMADKAMIGIQQLQDAYALTVRAPLGDSATLNPLPAAALRANLFSAYDANGQPTVASGTGADAGLRADLASSNPALGATLVYDAAKSSVLAASGGSALVGFTRSETGAVARTLQARLRDGVFLSTDFTTLQQALTAAAAAGRELVIVGAYALASTTLTVPSNSVVDAREASLTWNANVVGLEFGSNVDWLGGTWTGAGNSSYNSGGYACRCIGTYNHPAAPTFVIGPRIAGVTIDGWSNYGFWGQYTNGGYMRGCTVRNVGYNAVGGGSMNDFHEEFNLIENISPGVPAGDTYGTAIDRLETGSETSNPRSYRCSISFNTIKNVTNTAGNNAQAIDTHGGIDFSVIGNNIDGCEVGIVFTGSSVAGAQALGPKRCRAIGNSIRGAKVGYGILVSGAITGGSTVVDFAEDITLAGNTIDGHGASGDASGLTGAIFCQGTKRLSISGGSCARPAIAGVTLGISNIAFDIQGVAVTDAHDGTFAVPCAVHVNGNDNRGYIGNITAHYENGASGNQMVACVRVAAALTGLDVEIGPIVCNGADATHLNLSLGTTTGVNTAPVMRMSGRAQVALLTASASNTVAVTLPRRMPITNPRIFLTLASSPVPGAVVKPAVVESNSPTATGFNIIARPHDLTTFGGNGTLEVDWEATT